MRHPAGSPVRLTTVVTDVSGSILDPTGISVTIKKPDATMQTYSSPVHDSVGNYHQDIPATDIPQIGRYIAVWTFTGTGAGVNSDLFDIYDPFEIRCISLSDAKGYGNIPLTQTVFDTELQAMIDTSDDIIAKLIGGPILNTTITERVTAGQNFTSMAVRKRPLVSVISITDVSSGTLLDLSDLDVDTNSGVIRRNLGLPWFSRGGVYTVVYVAGLGTSVHSPIQEAAKVIVGHLWDTQHGPSIRPSMGGDDTVMYPGLGYAIPSRALELLSPYLLEAYV